MNEHFDGEFERDLEKSEHTEPDMQPVDEDLEELDEFEHALDALLTMSDDDYYYVLDQLKITPNPLKKPSPDAQPDTTKEDS